MKIFLAYGECTNNGGWRGGGEGTKKYVPEVSFEKLAPMYHSVCAVRILARDRPVTPLHQERSHTE